MNIMRRRWWWPVWRDESYIRELLGICRKCLSVHCWETVAGVGVSCRLNRVLNGLYRIELYRTVFGAESTSSSNVLPLRRVL